MFQGKAKSFSKVSEFQDKWHVDPRETGARKGTEYREDDLNGDGDEQDRLAAIAVGQRSVDYRPDGHAENIGRDDPLPVIDVGQGKIIGDQAERRQHDINGQRIEGHEAGHQDDQFDATDGKRQGFVLHLRAMARSDGRGYSRLPSAKRLVRAAKVIVVKPPED